VERVESRALKGLRGSTGGTEAPDAGAGSPTSPGSPASPSSPSSPSKARRRSSSKAKAATTRERGTAGAFGPDIGKLHRGNLQRLDKIRASNKFTPTARARASSAATSTTVYESTELSGSVDFSALQSALASKDIVIEAKNQELARKEQLLMKKDFEIASLRRRVYQLEKGRRSCSSTSVACSPTNSEGVEALEFDVAAAPAEDGSDATSRWAALAGTFGLFASETNEVVTCREGEPDSEKPPPEASVDSPTAFVDSPTSGASLATFGESRDKRRTKFHSLAKESATGEQTQADEQQKRGMWETLRKGFWGQSDRSRGVATRLAARGLAPDSQQQQQQQQQQQPFEGSDVGVSAGGEQSQRTLLLLPPSAVDRRCSASVAEGRSVEETASECGDGDTQRRGSLPTPPSAKDMKLLSASKLRRMEHRRALTAAQMKAYSPRGERDQCQASLDVPAASQVLRKRVQHHLQKQKISRVPEEGEGELQANSSEVQSSFMGGLLSTMMGGSSASSGRAPSAGHSCAGIAITSSSNRSDTVSSIASIWYTNGDEEHFADGLSACEVPASSMTFGTSIDLSRWMGNATSGDGEEEFNIWGEDDTQEEAEKRKAEFQALKDRHARSAQVRSRLSERKAALLVRRERTKRNKTLTAATAVAAATAPAGSAVATLTDSSAREVEGDAAPAREAVGEGKSHLWASATLPLSPSAASKPSSGASSAPTRATSLASRRESSTTKTRKRVLSLNSFTSLGRSAGFSLFRKKAIDKE